MYLHDVMTDARDIDMNDVEGVTEDVSLKKAMSDDIDWSFSQFCSIHFYLPFSDYTNLFALVSI